MGELLYKDLCYVLNGIFYKVFNNLGPGYRERFYCQAIKRLLKRDNIKFVYQHKVPLNLYEENVTKRYFDFLIDDKVIVEIKVGSRAYGGDFDQIKEYLAASTYKLGLLVVFRKEDVKSYRVLNPNNK